LVLGFEILASAGQAFETNKFLFLLGLV
jgi:hypothetical protein